MREASNHWKRAGRASLRACFAALLLAAAGHIGAGELDVAVVAGAEALATKRRLNRHYLQMQVLLNLFHQQRHQISKKYNSNNKSQVHKPNNSNK